MSSEAVKLVQWAQGRFPHPVGIREVSFHGIAGAGVVVQLRCADGTEAFFYVPGGFDELALDIIRSATGS
jgi:hypothetical protein